MKTSEEMSTSKLELLAEKFLARNEMRLQKGLMDEWTTYGMKINAGYVISKPSRLKEREKNTFPFKSFTTIILNI